jgi:hypothetical protein
VTAQTVAAFDREDNLRTGRNYLRAGDPCRISGERGVFRFVAVVTNTATGSVWAEVVGPAANPRTRSFRCDRVRRVRRDTPTR